MELVNYDKLKIEYSKNKLSSIYIYNFFVNYAYHFKNGNKFIGKYFFNFEEIYTLTRPDKISILTTMFCLSIDKEEISAITKYSFTK